MSGIAFNSKVCAGRSISVEKLEIPYCSSSFSGPEDFGGEMPTVFDIPINHIADMCLDITVEEDNIFEDTEFFGVNLISTTLQICPTNNEAIVGIIDTTRKYSSHHAHS